MIKGHTDIDIWNTGFFINADYFSDDFIIYNNTGKDLTRKTLAHPFFHNNSYKTTYTSFILCLSGTSEIEIDSINYSTKENTLLMMYNPQNHLAADNKTTCFIFPLKQKTKRLKKRSKQHTKSVIQMLFKSH